MLLSLKHCIIYIVLEVISCGIFQEDKVNILFDSHKMVSGDCGSGFTVLKEIDSDPFFRNELEKYLYKSFIDTEECEEFSPDLFGRDSFQKMILEVYLENYFLEYSIYDYERRWKESYINLLHYCTDQRVFYSLCDSLLLNNIDDGIIAVWDKDPKKLSLLKRYEKMNWTNYYQVAQLAAIYHNGGMQLEENRAIIQLKKLRGEEAILLLDLLNKPEKIDYFDFMEIVYGGM